MDKVTLTVAQLDEIIKYLDQYRQDWTDLRLETKTNRDNFDFEFWHERAGVDRDIAIRLQDIMWDLKRESMGIEKWHG